MLPHTTAICRILPRSAAICRDLLRSPAQCKCDGESARFTAPECGIINIQEQEDAILSSGAHATRAGWMAPLLLSLVGAAAVHCDVATLRGGRMQRDAVWRHRGRVRLRPPI